nr:MAG TPA: hypothetical protein [Bacteriophage sp.]
MKSCSNSAIKTQDKAILSALVLKRYSMKLLEK